MSEFPRVKGYTIKYVDFDSFSVDLDHLHVPRFLEEHPEALTFATSLFSPAEISLEACIKTHITQYWQNLILQLSKKSSNFSVEEHELINRIIQKDLPPIVKKDIYTTLTKTKEGCIIDYSFHGTDVNGKTALRTGQLSAVKVKGKETYLAASNKAKRQIEKAMNERKKSTVDLETIKSQIEWGNYVLERGLTYNQYNGFRIGAPLLISEAYRHWEFNVGYDVKGIGLLVYDMSFSADRVNVGGYIVGHFLKEIGFNAGKFEHYKDMDIANTPYPLSGVKIHKGEWMSTTDKGSRLSVSKESAHKRLIDLLTTGTSDYALDQSFEVIYTEENKCVVRFKHAYTKHFDAIMLEIVDNEVKILGQVHFMTDNRDDKKKHWVLWALSKTEVADRSLPGFVNRFLLLQELTA